MTSPPNRPPIQPALQRYEPDHFCYVPADDGDSVLVADLARYFTQEDVNLLRECVPDIYSSAKGPTPLDNLADRIAALLPP